MNPVLSVSNINYSIAGLDILRSLSLEVQEQQYFAIAGVDGAGKSTLIKLVLDLIRPQSGIIGWPKRSAHWGVSSPTSSKFRL